VKVVVKVVGGGGSSFGSSFGDNKKTGTGQTKVGEILVFKTLHERGQLNQILGNLNEN